MAIAKRKGTVKNVLSDKAMEMFKQRRLLLNENKRSTAEFRNLNRTLRKQIREDLE